ncbi:MAG: hypothetical protein COB36_06985 [Alphaproteobacteria bacterium]|nr:MAG: hypothetical protein COB36_06985 [Alphaproteobacteria bacterium]
MPMKISFCTTCMGRAHHLKETLPQNIRDNPATEGMDVEFVVLNYNSQDDLHEWMTTDPQMKAHIESGLVRYGKTTEHEEFYHSHAKNMAHRMATGDVLCNLDADNYTGPKFAQFLKHNFENKVDIIMSPSFSISREFPPEGRGFVGRISLSNDSFYKLAGYDEAFQGWGGEDTDITQRAKGLGLEHLRFEGLEYLKVIGHSDEDRVLNVPNAKDALTEINYKQNEESNLSKAINRIDVLLKPIQVNNGTEFGMGLVHMENGRDLQFGKVINEISSPFNVCALGLPELVRGRISPRIAEELNQDRSDDRPASEL